MSEITGRAEARLHRLGETNIVLSQFESGTYLLTAYAGSMSYSLHLNQDGVDQLHEMFAKFAQIKAEQW